MRTRLALMVAVTLGLTTGCAAPLPSPGGQQAGASSPTGGQEPTTAPATAPPTTTRPPAAPPTQAAPVTGAPCTAAMLKYDSMMAEGAAGTAFHTYTFHNGGSAACTVQGFPDLRYVNDAGSTVMVPVKHGTSGQAVLLQRGDRVQFVTSEVNGLGGYGPGSPECAHPATYRHVSVVLPGGGVSLATDATMSVECGDITANGWGRPDPS